jgi:hypothetical protein
MRKAVHSLTGGFHPLRWSVRIALIAAAIQFSGCNSDLFKSNEAPEITALQLDSYEVNPADTVTATVTVKDDDQNLTYEWTTDNGQFIPPTGGSQIKWKAPATGGSCRITVKVSNDEKSSSKSQTVTVRSLADPSVEILAPTEGGFWVQHSVLTVNAHARHENGIARVELYLNNHLKTTASGHSSSDYTLASPLDEPSGQATVKVLAVANVTNRVGADSVQIVIEGVVLGKANR